MTRNFEPGQWVTTKILFDHYGIQKDTLLPEVHPDDRSILIAQQINYFFKIIAVDPDFITLFSHSHTIRVKPGAISKLMNTPKFEWEEKVREKERPEIAGTVQRIVWHFKRQTYLYQLRVNGKLKKRLYLEDELEGLV